jgi:hypothetical protein
VKDFVSETKRMKLRTRWVGKPVPHASVRFHLVGQYLLKSGLPDEVNGSIDSSTSHIGHPSNLSRRRSAFRYVHWKGRGVTGLQIPDSINIAVPTGHRIGGTVVDENETNFWYSRSLS